MDYSLEEITSKSDCQLLIDHATKEKEALDFKIISLDRQAAVWGTTSVELSTDLAAANLRLTASNTIMATLPEGEDKNKEKGRNMGFERQVYLLTQRMDNYNAVAKLRLEYEKAVTLKEAEENAAFIAALQTRKAAIP